MRRPIKDGTRVLLDSVLLNLIFSKENADEIKRLLSVLINDQSKYTGTIIAFLCDRRACESCSYPNCTHTTNIRHAENFKLNGEHFEEKDEVQKGGKE